jgi:hypothetical protein
MTNQKLLKALKDGQAEYEKIANKQLHYVFLKNGMYREIILKANKHNFMHLCGVSYRDPNTRKTMNSNQFYKALKKNKLKSEGIIVKLDGTTVLKLDVLDQIKDLLMCNLRVIDDKSNFLNLTFDSAIRSRRKVFCLCLERISAQTFVPSSLLNLKTDKGNTIKGGFAVHCIYSIEPMTNNIQHICKTEEFIEYEKTKTYAYISVPQLI